MQRQGTRARWRKLIEEQERSGLSIAEFCRHKGFTSASFYQWRKKLRETPQPEDLFVPLHVIGSGGVEIEFACGAVLRVPNGDSQTLAQVVSLLKQNEEADG
jgi:hypothetical protein